MWNTFVDKRKNNAHFSRIIRTRYFPSYLNVKRAEMQKNLRKCDYLFSEDTISWLLSSICESGTFLLFEKTCKKLCINVKDDNDGASNKHNGEKYR